MNVNIEFFDSEPLENLITCLNFKMDKVIFFGHSDTMTENRIQDTRRALKNICEISDVEFVTVSQKSLYKVLELLEKEVTEEMKAGNTCFFDLSGGEDLVLVAMGMLATQYKVPLHKFALPENELYLLTKWDKVPRIDEVVPRRELQLTLDDIIGLHGGIINYRQQKDVKSNLQDNDFKDAVGVMWEIANDSQKKWNGLSSVFKECIKYEDEYHRVRVSVKAMKQAMKRIPDIISVKELRNYLNRLGNQAILERISIDEEMIKFSYKTPNIRDCLLDAGCLLELHTYYERMESGRYSDCRVGVHIDWDGEINGREIDVENEIDVMLLEGVVPVFISCKNGRVNQMALYELDAVSNRFGGKYVRKELAATQEITPGYLKRAEEMNIIVDMQK
ncbi:MAG: DUF1887 family protein [Lachnospiraceae bacterium]|nr:DUF1887 family protein [Lachnospiraceae bacterium]